MRGEDGTTGQHKGACRFGLKESGGRARERGQGTMVQAGEGGDDAASGSGRDAGAGCSVDGCCDAAGGRDIGGDGGDGSDGGDGG